MMLGYLLIAIFFITSLFVLLKLFEKYEIDNFRGIVINYLVASALSFMVGFENNVKQLSVIYSFYPVAIIIGILFITAFNLIALTAQKSGVAVASIAGKLSMIIPIVAGIILYNETVNMQKITGIAIALVAVVIVNAEEGEKFSLSVKHLTLPLLTFIGSGLVDAFIKYAEHYYMNDATRQVVISFMFGSAGTIGLVIILIQYILKKKKFSLKTIFGGIILGTCNYLSLYFMIKCLGEGESSLIFALVNVGVVVLSVFAAQLFFKEEMNRTKITGVMLALVAIAVLYFS